MKPYNFRNRSVVEPINSRTNWFASSFYPFCVNGWNNSQSSLRALPSISQFKMAIFRIISQKKKIVCQTPQAPSYWLDCASNLMELREQQCRNNFSCTDPMCLCGNEVEDNEHFLLHWQRFSIHRISYLDNISQLIKRSSTTLSGSLLCNIYYSVIIN